jgi:hypothetical protein
MTTADAGALDRPLLDGGEYATIVIDFGADNRQVGVAREASGPAPCGMLPYNVVVVAPSTP